MAASVSLIQAQSYDLSALQTSLVPLRGIQNAKFKVKNCCCARILSVLNSRLISALVY